MIKDPQHPYTRLLVDSIPWPNLDQRWGEHPIKAREAGGAGATAAVLHALPGGDGRVQDRAAALPHRRRTTPPPATSTTNSPRSTPSSCPSCCRSERIPARTAHARRVAGRAGRSRPMAAPARSLPRTPRSMLEIAEIIRPTPSPVWKLAKQAGVDLAVGGLPFDDLPGRRGALGLRAAAAHEGALRGRPGSAQGDRGAPAAQQGQARPAGARRGDRHASARCLRTWASSASRSGATSG